MPASSLPSLPSLSAAPSPDLRRSDVALSGAALPATAAQSILPWSNAPGSGGLSGVVATLALVLSVAGCTVPASGTAPAPAAAVPTRAASTRAEPTRSERTQIEPTRSEPTQAEPTRSEPTLARVPSDPYPGTQRRVMFRCATGEELEMRFYPAQGVAVLVRDGRTAELQQQPAASGFRYEGPGQRVLGKGRELRLEQDGAEPLDCVGLMVRTDGGK